MVQSTATSSSSQCPTRYLTRVRSALRVQPPQCYSDKKEVLRSIMITVEPGIAMVPSRSKGQPPPPRGGCLPFCPSRLLKNGFNSLRPQKMGEEIGMALAKFRGCLSRELRGCCPHPRAPGALALSLDRER